MIDHESGFVKNSGNPIIGLGASGAADDYTVYGGVPVTVNGIDYIFYNGGRATPTPRHTMSVYRAKKVNGAWIKQGLAINRASVGFGDAGEGISIFGIVPIGSKFYALLSAFRSGSDFALAVMEATNIEGGWTNFTIVADAHARDHAPCWLEDPEDSSRCCIYYSYTDAIGKLVIGRASFAKSNPYSWTFSASPVLQHATMHVLYPEVRWVGYYEMLYTQGPDASGHYRIHKTGSRDKMAFPISTLVALGVGPATWDGSHVSVPRWYGNDLLYTARPTDVDVYQGVGLCSWGSVGSLAQWDWAEGVVQVTTAHPYDGSYGVKLIGGTAKPALGKIAEGKGKVYSVRIYDDLATTANLQNSFRLLDSAGNNVTVGIWVGTSTTKYIYRTHGGSWTASAINRTLGQHEFVFVVTDTQVEIWIDGTLVAYDTTFNVDDLDRVMLQGFTGGTAYADTLSITDLV